MENNADAIFEGLNSEQRNAVACLEGPVLIIAGAGSGKTRVLTSRVAYLLEKGFDPSSILCLTFTKKAATEMKERISLMVGERRARRVWMGTFHSVFIRFLREYAEKLGYPSSFTIYDTSDSVSAIKSCVKELQLDDKIYKPKEVLARISMAKNNLITDQVYRNRSEITIEDSHSRKPRICDIYSLYVKKCRQNGVMDFDDILLNMNILLRDFPEALEAISARFTHILVDEYQDTNFSQYLIIKKLSMHHRNICVVGDDSQSIYAFRGAKIENILNFRKDYPEARLFKLERNYRSTGNIVNAANSLIDKNKNRLPKECYSVGEDGDKIRLIKSYSEQEEAVLITSGILDTVRKESARYQDFAILYRTNAQSRALEEALRKRNIPYMIYSGNSFFDRAEVKDFMAYFKLVVNPNDDESFKRVVNKPARGIGGTSEDALAMAARTLGCTLFRAVYSERLLDFGLKSAAIAKLRAFTDMIDRLSQLVATTDAETLAKKIADDSGLYRFYREDTSIEGQARTANVEELVSSVASYVQDRKAEFEAEQESEGTVGEMPVVRLDEFLENISLLSNIDIEDEEDTNNKVSLMTVHSSKGLEFPYVYVAGMEENLFPSGGSLASSSDIEEERRLFYVAITRAGRKLALSFADSRMRNGKTENNSPSRFIREIDSRYIENPLEEARVFGGGGTQSFSTGRNSYGQSGRPVRMPRQGLPQQSQYGSRQSAPASRPSIQPRPSVPAAPQGNRYNEATFIAAPMASFSIGQRIEHLRFGPGMILDLSGRVPDVKAKIKFDDFPEPKIILLKYAKMRAEEK